MDKINARHIADTKTHTKQIVVSFKIRMRTINIVITISNNFITLRQLNFKLKVDRTFQACNHNNLICIHSRDLDIQYNVF